MVPIPSGQVDGLIGKRVKSPYSSRCCKLIKAFETDGHFSSTLKGKASKASESEDLPFKLIDSRLSGQKLGDVQIVAEGFPGKF